MTLTILTTTAVIEFPDHDEFARDDAGNAYVYDGDTTVATIKAEAFVAAVNGTVDAGADSSNDRDYYNYGT